MNVLCIICKRSTHLSLKISIEQLVLNFIERKYLESHDFIEYVKS